MGVGFLRSPSIQKFNTLYGVMKMRRSALLLQGASLTGRPGAALWVQPAFTPTPPSQWHSKWGYWCTPIPRRLGTPKTGSIGSRPPRWPGWNFTRTAWSSESLLSQPSFRPLPFTCLRPAWRSKDSPFLLCLFPFNVHSCFSHKSLPRLSLSRRLLLGKCDRRICILGTFCSRSSHCPGCGNPFHFLSFTGETDSHCQQVSKRFRTWWPNLDMVETTCWKQQRLNENVSCDWLEPNNKLSLPNIKTTPGTSLVVQWLRLHAPNAGGLGSISGQGTRSHMVQLRVHMPQQRSRVLQLRPSEAK